MMDRKKIILFDGVCNLCNGFVQFVIKRDKSDQFRFAALQSDIGTTLTQKHDIPQQTMNSVILIKENRYYEKSSAAIYILKDLKGYKWMKIFIYLPKKLRDILYSFIARNRYKWFGKRDSCMIPTPELKAKFLK